MPLLPLVRSGMGIFPQTINGGTGSGGGRWRGWLRRAPRFLLPIVIILVLGLVASWIGYLLGRGKPFAVPRDRFAVSVLNVGQGEASVIRTPHGKFIVIGGGPPGQGRAVTETLREQGAEKIDLLILPYPYAEAIGGVPDMIRGVPVLRAVAVGGPNINQWQRQVESSLQSAGTRVETGRAGKRLTVDGATVEILAPAEPLLTTPPAAANNSLVVRIGWGSTHFLWAGGLEARGEQSLLSRLPNLSAQWLRVAHFGTRDASSPEFLRLVKPEVAVISVGPNRSGYPHPETVTRLLATGARVYQTDQQVAPLHFNSDGTEVFGPY